MNFKILQENNYLPSMIFLLLKIPIQNSFWPLKLYLLTDFQNFLQVLLGQIKIKMLTRKYFSALQKTEILPENPVSETKNHTLFSKGSSILRLKMVRK